MNRSITRFGFLSLALVAVAACSKKDTDDKADTTAGAAAVDTATPAAPALTDANIVYILDNASALDSSAGSVAATKGTSADVKGFAKMMMRDHHALRKQGADLAAKLGVIPAAPANDDSQASTDKTLALLNSTAKGKDFDKAYIDNEVTYHTAVLQTATAALGAAQNAELKDLITKAAPNIQAHLDKAKSIQAKQQ